MIRFPFLTLRKKVRYGTGNLQNDLVYWMTLIDINLIDPIPLVHGCFIDIDVIGMEDDRTR